MRMKIFTLKMNKQNQKVSHAWLPTHNEFVGKSEGSTMYCAFSDGIML